MAIAHLAENRGVVVAAYVVAFFPWGMMYLHQLLNPNKCNESAACKRGLLINSISSLPGIAYLCFYIHLQNISGNYQEMCLAIYAIFFNIFHIIRTVIVFATREGKKSVDENVDDEIVATKV